MLTLSKMAVSSMFLISGFASLVVIGATTLNVSLFVAGIIGIVHTFRQG